MPNLKLLEFCFALLTPFLIEFNLMELKSVLMILHPDKLILKDRFSKSSRLYCSEFRSIFKNFPKIFPFKSFFELLISDTLLYLIYLSIKVLYYKTF